MSMTAKEKLLMEHPDKRSTGHYGGVVGCPYDYGYLPIIPECEDDDWYPCEEHCTACWNREIPGTENYEKENENMTTTKKTKAELLEEIKNLQTEIDKLDKYRKYEEAADEMRALYDSFVNAGFTEDQAFELMMTMIKMGGCMK